jgi:hypothetical protein
MALLCNAVLLARSGLQAMSPMLIAIGLGIGVGCIALFVVRGRERRLLNAQEFVLPIAEVQLAAALTVIASALAAYAILS